MQALHICLKLWFTMNEDKRVIVLGNVFPSKGQNGDVFEMTGLSPCLRSGQGIKGRGIGSCNAPKIVVYEDVFDCSNGRR